MVDQKAAGKVLSPDLVYTTLTTQRFFQTPRQMFIAVNDDYVEPDASGKVVLYQLSAGTPLGVARMASACATGRFGARIGSEGDCGHTKAL